MEDIGTLCAPRDEAVGVHFENPYPEPNQVSFDEPIIRAPPEDISRGGLYDVECATAPNDKNKCMGKSSEDSARPPGTSDNTDSDAPNRLTKRHIIRKQRQTTIQAPELMSATRRARLCLRPSQTQTVEHLSVSHALQLHYTETKKVLFRHVEGLDRQEDEDSYFRTVANEAAVRLVTAGISHHAWQCFNVIGLLSVPSSSGREGVGHSYQRELCHHINPFNAYACISCGKHKPNLRPFFVRLRRIALAMKAQRIESIKRMKQCDAELTRHESALVEARMKLAKLRERKEKHSLVHSEDENGVDDEENDWSTMDIDLAQNGVWQRIDVRSLVPILVSNRHRYSKQLSQIRTELAMLIQATFEMAAPHIQKIIRGHLVRTALDSMRRMLTNLAQFAAAVEIQRMARSLLAKMEKQRRYQALCNVIATRIQTYVRRKLAYIEYQRRWKEYIDELHRLMTIRIQRLYRNWMLIQKAKRIAEELRRQREEANRAKLAQLRNDASILIQSWIRRHLAKWAVHDKQIEAGLSYRLSKLLDQFMIDGDLWQFLKCIDRDYRRYENVLLDILEREDEMAATFVSKVTRFREDQHTSAWDAYENLLQKVKELQRYPKEDSLQHSAIITPASSPPPRASLTRALQSLSLKESSKYTDVEYQQTYNGEPGDRFNMYRTETIQRQRRQQQRGKQYPRRYPIVNDSSRKKSIAASHPQRNNQAYHENDVIEAVNLQGCEGRPLDRRQNISFSPPSDASRNDVQFIGDEKNSSTPTFGIMDWQSDRRREMERMGFSLLASTHFPSGGDILRRDLPGGLDDTLERFLRVASLRSYCPPTSPGITALNKAEKTSIDFIMTDADKMNKKTVYNSKRGGENEEGRSAYQIYLDLPPGLDKINFERRCYDHIKPLVSELRRKGYTHIRQLLPREKFLSTLESLEYKPSVVTDEFVVACDRLLSQLQIADRLGLGLRTKLAKKYCEMTRKKRSNLSPEAPSVKRGLAEGEKEDRDAMIHAAPYLEESEVDEEDSLPGGLWIQTSKLESDIDENKNSKKEVNLPVEAKAKSIAEINQLVDNEDSIDTKNSADMLSIMAVQSETLYCTSSVADNARNEFQKDMDSMVHEALIKLQKKSHHQSNEHKVATTSQLSSDEFHSNEKATIVYSRGGDEKDGDDESDVNMQDTSLKGGLFYPRQVKHRGKRITRVSTKLQKRQSFRNRKADHATFAMAKDTMRWKKRQRFDGSSKGWVVPYTRRVLREAGKKFPIYDQCRHTPHIVTDPNPALKKDTNEILLWSLEERDKSNLNGKCIDDFNEEQWQNLLPKDVQIDVEEHIANLRAQLEKNE